MATSNGRICFMTASGLQCYELIGPGGGPPVGPILPGDLIKVIVWAIQHVLTSVTETPHGRRFTSKEVEQIGNRAIQRMAEDWSRYSPDQAAHSTAIMGLKLKAVKTPAIKVPAIKVK